MPSGQHITKLLDGLNDQQREAVQHGDIPLLIVAGAGTGKTATLVYRVAWLVANGVRPHRILLLTFTRRAAEEMLRRASGVLQDNLARLGRSLQLDSKVWGGTFHSVATRLLRMYASAVGLSHEFTIMDRTDAEDFMNLVRSELGLASKDRRFPKKGTCMDIYSRCINAQQRLSEALKQYFPWCLEWERELGRLFDAYVERKQAASALDYDDLLVYWIRLLEHPEVGEHIRRLFDYVLVDEYQDTNVLQAHIVYRLSPEGRGLTVVGDDAQAIYSFRAATVHNILQFQEHYPNARIVYLEHNYRSTQAVLDAANAVIAEASMGYKKSLFSDRKNGPKPQLVTCRDEYDQAKFVADQVLELRERGIQLRQQAVLFRASHHSIALEVELTHRGIPFHKYGGLKFIEAAHVKDVLAFLRLVENPRDLVAGLRILTMLPGVGPATGRKLMEQLAAVGGDFVRWAASPVPDVARQRWRDLTRVLITLKNEKLTPAEQLHVVRQYYTPLLQELYDNPIPRSRDVEQLEVLAARYPDRRSMLADLALNPPASTQDLAGPPELDDDFLVLSTIHSAKGLEWDAVFVIHATDGNIPSDMATGDEEQIEEERRIFYVAITRAKTYLYVCYPLFYYHSSSYSSDQYGMAQLTRFISQNVIDKFDRRITQEAEQLGYIEPPPQRRWDGHPRKLW